MKSFHRQELQMPSRNNIKRFLTLSDVNILTALEKALNIFHLVKVLTFFQDTFILPMEGSCVYYILREDLVRKNENKRNR